ncbi:hypothetical protein FB451DRAFT_1173323 [Mycena latifolia]|nr:hypothetical protein FB451DRAFT_1173323 [Mycena latifolia]
MNSYPGGHYEPRRGTARLEQRSDRISMSAIESFNKYEELDIRRAEEIEIRKSTAVPRNARNEGTLPGQRGRRETPTKPDALMLQTPLSPHWRRSSRKHEKLQLLAATLKLKLARAEAKSNSSGRVRACASTATSTTAVATANAALPKIASIAAESDAMDPDAAGGRRRRKKLEDPLAGWVMQDPDTGEQLSGHEWVKRYPEEFAEPRRIKVATWNT